MAGVRGRAVRLGLAALLPLAGCSIGGSVFNPDFIQQLGLDPATFNPSPGVVLVAFDNQTTSEAVFYAYTAPDVGDLTTGSRNFSVVAEANQVRNEVLDCPVGIVSPGSLGTDFTPDTLGAQVVVVTATAVETVDVNYDGFPVVVGTAFTCGDVIEIRLSEVVTGTGDQQQQAFAITVRVIRS